MSIIVDNEEYYSVTEALDYLGGISYPTLRNRTKAAGIFGYKQGVSRNVYYRKSDLDKLLDKLKEFRPIIDDENERVDE